MVKARFNKARVFARPFDMHKHGARVDGVAFELHGEIASFAQCEFAEFQRNRGRFRKPVVHDVLQALNARLLKYLL